MNHLGLFAKFWEPGRVKTRLAKKTGPLHASQVYFLFLRHLLTGLDDVGDLRTVGYSPVDKQAQFEDSIELSWKLTPQSDGDLGERMEKFFVWAHQKNREFSDPGDRSCVVLIGSDTPHLPIKFISDAFDLLLHRSVVLGPSTDGGYYLVGMSEKCYPIFENVDWSTDRVLQQTIDRMEQDQIDYAFLPPMTDIDHFEDLIELTDQLITKPENFAARDQDLLEAIENITGGGRR